MCSAPSSLSYRCTVGEVSDALEEAWGRHRPSTAVVRGAYSSSYNEAVGVSCATVCLPTNRASHEQL